MTFNWDPDSWEPTRTLFALGLGAALLAIVTLVAERRQARRTDLDRVSLIPWRPVSLMAMVVAIVAFSVALRSGA